MTTQDQIRRKLEEEYWLNKMKGSQLDPFFLVEDPYPGPRGQLTADIPPEVTAAIASAGSIGDGDNVGIFLTALAVTLFRYTGAGDNPLIANTYPLADSSLQGLVFFRLLISAADVGTDLIQRINEQARESSARRPIDFEALIRKYEMLGMGDLRPLLQLGFSYEPENTTCDLPKNLTVIFRVIDCAHISLNFDKRMAQAGLLPGFLGHYLNVLRQLLESPGLSVWEFTLLSLEEQAHLVTRFNDSSMPSPADKTLVDLIMERTATTPDVVALVCESRRLTYRELNERANAVATHLRREFKVCPDDTVAVVLRRSEWMIIGMVGILKAGAAVVPIDAATPAYRIGLMLEDSGCRTVLTDADFIASYHHQGPPLVDVSSIAVRSEENPCSVNSPADLAFVVYTSGSTGRPKGVMIQHNQMVNKLFTALAQFSLTSDVRCLLVAFFSSDAALYQIFCTLLAGGRLHLIDVVKQNEPREFWKTVSSARINFINCVPSFMAAMLEGLPPDLQIELEYLMLGSDVIPVSLFRQIKDRLVVRQLVNLYGPTEVTVEATWYGFTEPLRNKTIPIGKPSANYKVYILDEYQQLVPIGVPGEIYIGGRGVARGYLNSPELTAEKFLPDPFGHAQRLFRTGDVAKWLPDGNIEFLGRSDDQVKIRGHRIELKEIESLLLEMPGISEAVLSVSQIDHSEKELVCYLVAKNDLNVSHVRTHLKRFLPHYMIPSQFVLMDRLRLTPSGKIDRKSLPDVAPLMEVRDDYIAPRSEVEIRLAEIFREVLKREDVGVNDDFFVLGGHSLKAIQVVTRINVAFQAEVGIREIFDYPTISELAAFLSTGLSFAPQIQPLAQREYYNLSPAQTAMWLLLQISNQPAAYNMPEAYLMDGKLDLAAFRLAFDALVLRHESMRTTVTNLQGTPKQRVSSQPSYSMEFYGFLQPSIETSAIRRAFEKEAFTPFDLEAGPLLRVRLYTLGLEKNLLIINMHHIVADGWSFGVLLREVLDSYECYACGEAPVRAPLRIQYKDYAAWHEVWLNTPQALRDREYWNKRLAGELPRLALPTDRARPPVRSLRGAREFFTVNGNLTQDLRRLNQAHQVTMFMTLVSLVNCLLYRYAGQSDIVVGTPVAGRNVAELDEQIGLFVNLVPLRFRLDSKQSFVSTLASNKIVVLEAFEHAGYPFARLVDELAPERSLSSNPLFDVVVLMEVTDDLDAIKEFKSSSKRSVHITPLDLKMDVCPFDLVFSFLEREELKLTIDYNADIYEPQSIRRLGEHFLNLFKMAVANPERAVADLSALSKAEEQAVVARWRTAGESFALEETIADLFEERAAIQPEEIAIVYQGCSLTYRELNEQSNRIAHCLQKVYGVGADDVVSVINSSPDLALLTALGVLKAGAAYLPIVLDESSTRVEFILVNSGAKLLVTESKNAERFERLIEVLAFDSLGQAGEVENPVRRSGPTSLAYVIYTSGSTGEPKGVMIENRGIVNNLRWRAKHYGYSSSSRVLQVTSFSFDTSVADIFTSLVTGGTLFLVPQELRMDLEYSADLIAQHHVNLFMMTTSLYQVFLDHLAKPLPSLRTIVIGGELLLPTLVSQHFQKLPNVGLFSEYGATECGVCSSVYSCRPDAKVLTVGNPIANSGLYVLDGDAKLAPIGVTGEICLSGVGLARGYLNDPILTANKFFSNPYHAGELIYRTGDLGRRLVDGSVEFLGRSDTQVKIRGYRVEIAEIEKALSGFPTLRQAIVIAEDNKLGETELVAYVMSSLKIGISELRTFLKPLLPDYMVPARCVWLREFPRLPTGKVNRRLLSLAGAKDTSMLEPRTEPRNPLDLQLLELWRELLDTKDIGIDDNFFELGGHSLKGIKLAANIQTVLGVRVPLAELFENQTIRQLTDFLESGGVKLEPAIIPRVPEQAHYEVSHAQKRLWMMAQDTNTRAASVARTAFSLHDQINEELFWQALDTVVARHDSFRTTFALIDGELRQRVHDQVTYDRTVADLRGLPDIYRKVSEELNADAAELFDLERLPLMKAKLLRVEQAKYVMILTIHHIVCDGWGLGVMIGELIEIYCTLCSGKEQRLPSLGFQYKDYAVWHNQLLAGSEGDRMAKYWHAKFAEPPPLLQLPLDFSRPPTRRYEAGSVDLVLDAETSSRLIEFSLGHEATLFMTLCSSFATLLFHLTGQDDLVIGFPAACRHHPGLDSQVGCFINPIPLRIKMSPDQSFFSLLKTVRQGCLEAYDCQDYPFDLMVRDAKIVREAGRSPFFDVGFTWDPVTSDIERAGSLIAELPHEDATINDDLRLFGFEKGGRIEVILVYNLALFRQQTVLNMAEALERIIRSVLDNDRLTLGDFPIGDDPAGAAEDKLATSYEF